MIAVPFLSMLSVPSEGAVSATGGSGTADDPFSGRITGDLFTWPYDTTMYVEVGTTFDADAGDWADGDQYRLLDPQIFGLRNDNDTVTGTVSHTGVIFAEIMATVYAIVVVDSDNSFPEESAGAYWVYSDSSSYHGDNPPSISGNVFDSISLYGYPGGYTVSVYSGSYIYINADMDRDWSGDITGDTTGLTYADGILSGVWQGMAPLYIGDFSIEPVSLYVHLTFESDPSEGTIQFNGS